MRVNNNIFALIIFSLVLSASSLFGAVYVKPELVNQPAYHHMNFYVYKPANLPQGFYSTFDGYIVYRGEHGIWHYASAEKSGIIKTGYVVGSVIPYVVRLKPHNSKIASAAPIYNTDRVDPSPSYSASASTGIRTPEIVYVPPVRFNPASINVRPEGYKTLPVYSLEQTAWSQDANFMSVSKWQNSIDRIGVISRPYIPVAWKGDYPEVIYVWTGAKWRELFPRGTDKSALSTMRREIYDLTVEANKSNSFYWSEKDTRILAQYAAMWGYRWMGIINLGRR